MLIIHDHMLTRNSKNLQMKQLANRYTLKLCFQEKMRFVEKNKVILRIKRNNRRRIPQKNLKHLLYVVI